VFPLPSSFRNTQAIIPSKLLLSISRHDIRKSVGGEEFTLFTRAVVQDISKPTVCGSPVSCGGQVKMKWNNLLFIFLVSRAGPGGVFVFGHLWPVPKTSRDFYDEASELSYPSIGVDDVRVDIVGLIRDRGMTSTKKIVGLCLFRDSAWKFRNRRQTINIRTIWKVLCYARRSSIIRQYDNYSPVNYEVSKIVALSGVDSSSTRSSSMLTMRKSSDRYPKTAKMNGRRPGLSALECALAILGE
jgi:hypothetical protein